MWTSANAKSRINSYEGVIYGGWLGCSLWLDTSFAYSYNRVLAHRNFFSASPNPFVFPVAAIFQHRNSSNLFAWHFGSAYELYNFDLWCVDGKIEPIFNLNYYYAHQPTFTERSASPLALTILEKDSTLLLPEIGAGTNFCTKYDYLDVSLYIALTYMKEIRFEGKNTKAFFVNNPTSLFVVEGLLPENNLLCPMIQLDLISPCENVEFSAIYRGRYGSKFCSNTISLEYAYFF